MEERRSGRLEPIPPVQLGLLVAAIVALAVIVAAASRPGDAGPTAPPSSVEAGAAILRAGLVLAALFEAGVLALVAWALWPGRRRVKRRAGGGERWLYIAVSYLQAAAVIVLVWLFVHFRGAGAGGGGALSGIFFRPRGITLPSGPDSAAAGGTLLTAAIVASVLLLVAAFVVRALLRRRGRSATPLQRLARRLQDAVEEGLQGLEDEPDPRRAVIAAYAGMERSLARAGVPRRSSETALEYLRRLLEMLRLDSPAVTRLTDLFQVAKFSAHPVDVAMKGEAIEALVAIRDDLRELVAEPQPVVIRA